MKTPEETEGTKSTVKKPEDKPAGEVHTDFPLSEKDEVKKAEENLQKGQKKQDK
ncbi:MAG: hypothetical protein V4619_07660 [Bacteroidota bacterium]